MAFKGKNKMHVVNELKLFDQLCYHVGDMIIGTGAFLHGKAEL